MKNTLALLCILLAASLSIADVITPIHDIQYTTDVSGDSPLVDTLVNISGVVTGAGPYGFYVSDAAGAWNGVYVYTQSEGCAFNVGDGVTVTGTVKEYFGMTEISGNAPDPAVVCSLNSTGNAVVPLPLSTLDAAQEQYEGVLVEFSAVTVTLLDLHGEWTVDDGTGGIIIDDEGGDYDYTPALSDTVSSIVGIVGYGYSNWRVQPRFSADIVDPQHPMHYALYGNVVTMNDTMDVLVNHYVEVLGTKIVGVTASAPGGVQVIPVNGLIFPGLIDAHNHPQYNVLGVIPFGQYFQDRGEWQATQMYTDFNTQYYGIRDYGLADAQYDDMWKLAEVRAMAAGTTMIQGSNTYSHSSDGYARLGIGIENAGRFPSHAFSQTFPLTYGSWSTAFSLFWNRFVVHLSEGVSTAAHDEFTTWQTDGHLDDRTSVIHGVALDTTQLSALAGVNGSLIWSPKSNWVLYGSTADVPTAIGDGVNIALAPDWTESGSRDMLDEIRFAHAVDLDNWGNILSSEWLALAVTRNAAFALGMEDRIGEIAPGYQADLAVFPGNPAAPYDALLASHAADVKLTVVAGHPAYGDPAIMDQFTTLSNVESVSMCGNTKRLVLEVDNFAIPESDKTFATVLSELQTAYDATTPKVCDFMGLDPCSDSFIFTDGFETSGTSVWSVTAP